MERLIERTLRWLLAPIYLGLALLLTLFVVQFFQDLWHAARGVVIVVIAAIHLLQACLEIEDVADDKLLWRVIVVLTFVVAALGLAWLDRLTVKDTTNEPLRE